jgi:hypothetical protein
MPKNKRQRVPEFRRVKIKPGRLFEATTEKILD